MSEFPKRILSLLMVMGAQSSDRAMSIDELATKLGMGRSAVESELKSLIDAGYAKLMDESGTRAVYLTATGIITASSTYS
jgi:DNA-binding transcriptional regulator GbsR (MarR family)